MMLGVMLTYKRKFRHAIRTLRHMSYLDHFTVLVPRGQGKQLQDRMNFIRGPFPNMVIAEHDVQQTTSNGLVRHGALRHYQMTYLQRHLRNSDIGLLIDDDLNQAQGINVDSLNEFKAQRFKREKVANEAYGRKWEHLGFHAQYELRARHGLLQLAFKLSPEQIRQKIRAISDLLRARDPHGFFTFAYAARYNNALVKRRVPTRWIKWSGVLGVLPDSGNPFDPDILSCEDWDAAGRILCDFKATLLADPSAAFNMDIECAKYSEGGPLHADRLSSRQRITDKYHFRSLPVFSLGRTAVGQLPALTCNHRVMRILREES